MSGRPARAALMALAAAAALAAAPAAYAVWTAAGSGSAVATGGAGPQPVTIAPGTVATQALYPTGTPTGDVAVSITNPNPYRVHVAALELDSASGIGGFSANAAACGLTFARDDDGWDVPAGSSVPVDLRGSLAMATWAPAACEGLAVQVYLRAAP
jgi:hypothetical protein